MARTRSRTEGPDGLLVVDKPAGRTSHDVVDRVRRCLGTRRVGHTGTLDPFATGVLVVCVGQATRLVRFLVQDRKTYWARLRFGFATSTDDLTGLPLGEPRECRLDRAQLTVLSARFVGEIEQATPTFAARRVAGRRLYELAREGRPLSLDEVPRVRVTIHRLELLEVSGDCAELEVECSSGTYVRALARDLGEDLGTGAHLTALRRLRSGPFDLESATSWEALAEEGRRRLRPPESLLPEWQVIRLNEAGREALRHGRVLTPRHADGEWPARRSTQERVRLLGRDERMLGVGIVRGAQADESESIQPEIVFLGSEETQAEPVEVGGEGREK